MQTTGVFHRPQSPHKNPALSPSEISMFPKSVNGLHTLVLMTPPAALAVTPSPFPRLHLLIPWGRLLLSGTASSAVAEQPHLTSSCQYTDPSVPLLPTSSPQFSPEIPLQFRLHKRHYHSPSQSFKVPLLTRRQNSTSFAQQTRSFSNGPHHLAASSTAFSGHLFN